MKDPAFIALVNVIELLHLVIAQLKIEYLDVLGDALGPHALRDDDDATLHLVAQQYLGRRLVVCLGDLLDDGKLQETRQDDGAVALDAVRRAE